MSSIGIRCNTSGEGFTVCEGEVGVNTDFATFTGRVGLGSKLPLLKTHEEVLNYFGYSLGCLGISLVVFKCTR